MSARSRARLCGGAGLELAGEDAEFVGAVIDETAETGILHGRTEGADRFGDVLGDRADADAELDDTGG